MNMREAKAYVLRCLSVEARHHIDNGSEWLEKPLASDNIQTDKDGEFTQADQARLCEAVRQVSDELQRRSERLARQRR